KTTLTKIISQSFINNIYFNWDIAQNRAELIQNPLFFENIVRKDASIPLVVFDEIHKYKDWKNYLKGVYDQFHGTYHFLVSGSGRLDIYQKDGDSLAGRYFQFHLWPFTIAEIADQRRRMDDFLKNPAEIAQTLDPKLSENWDRLSKMSGFPEPYLANRQTTYRRWSANYSSQIIREDIRDLAAIKFVGEMETLYRLLPSKIGSPLSLSSIASDLKVSYNTIYNWLSVFERFFLIFSIGPWTRKIHRSIQKERKVYLWDSPKIEDPGARFENMVALELWRAVTNWNDLGYGDFSLSFLKNKEKQEVDFLIADGRKPLILIEAKMTDPRPSNALRKYQEMLNVPAVQVTHQENGFRKISNKGQMILVAPAQWWLSGLP
ncbi:MAG: ATP-binding protein, partial [Pseudomonadota bacterium]